MIDADGVPRLILDAKLPADAGAGGAGGADIRMLRGERIRLDLGALERRRVEECRLARVRLTDDSHLDYIGSTSRTLFNPRYRMSSNIIKK